jgi:hypothetical protein
MTFFKQNLAFLILLGTLVGCSGQVQDKNSALSNSEKEELRTNEEENSLEIASIKFESQNDIKEDQSANSNIVSKYYSLKVCVKDNKVTKGLGNRQVRIDGELMRTDSSGCVVWDHEIVIDHTADNKCNVYEKTIRFSKKRTKTIKYSIDYVNNQVSDLGKSNGCVQKENVTKTIRKISPVLLEDISLTYVPVQTVLRSDIRWIRHQTKVNTCLKVRMTGTVLSNAKIKITGQNLETGEKFGAINNRVLKTNHKGCFTTDIVTKYEQYRNSHWMELDLNIEVKSGPLAGTNVGRSVYINPWESSRSLYGIGEEGRLPNEEHKFKDDYARFHMDGVMYIQIGNDTKKMTVNDYLGLTIAKTYQVVLSPYVDREHRYTNGQKPIERLTATGKFKLSMVILAPKHGDMEINKNNYDNYDFVTGIEQEVELSNGIVNAVVNIPFKMTDLPRLSLRTISLLKIEAIGDTGLQSSIVTGFFKARIPWIKTNVLPAKDLNIPDYVDQTWKHMKDTNSKQMLTPDQMDAQCSNQKSMTALDCLKGVAEIKKSGIDSDSMNYRKFVGEMFDKLSLQTSKMNRPFKAKVSPKKIFVNHLEKNYEGIEIHDIQSISKSYGIKVKSSDFDEMLPTNKTNNFLTKNMIEELCRYGFHKDGAFKKVFGFFYTKKSYDKCLSNPYKYFGVKAVRHVQEVDGIGESYTSGFGIYVGTRYGVSNGERDAEAVSESWSYGTDLGGKIPLPGDFINLGFKAGYNKSYSTSHSESSGFDFGENIGTSKNLGVEKFVIDVQAKMQRCVLITSRDFLDSKLARERAAQRIGAYPTMMGVTAAELRSEEHMSEEDKAYYSPQTNLNMTYYICDTAPKKETFTEAWYFIQSRINASMATDYDSVNERKLLKVIRGNQSYLELRNELRKKTEFSLYTDNIAYQTPEDILISSWGHLVGKDFTDEDAAKFLVENVEGSFPGTIEGNGSTRADDAQEIDKY